MTNTPNTAATKAGDFKCPKCGWLARNADGCAVCTPPAEPALAAEGAVVLSDAERAELCDFCIWLGDHQENPGTRRRLGRIAQIFNATAAPDPAQSADTRTEKQRFIQRMNYSLWMENQREGCEPSADWQEGYREGKKFAEALQELREASEQSADTPSEAPVAWQRRCDGGEWLQCSREQYVHTVRRGNAGVVGDNAEARALYALRQQPARDGVSEATKILAIAIAHIAHGIPDAREVAADALSQAAALEAAARVRADHFVDANKKVGDVK